MKLPFIEAIKQKILHRVPDHLSMRSMSVDYRETEVTKLSLPPKIAVQSSATVWYEQYIDEGTPVEFTRHKAAQAIARNVYGPIEDELRYVMMDLQSIGLHDNDPAVQRIREIIETIRMEN